MKLIKQAHLYFNEGNSDKVYEIDLCEVGNNEFLVNFRYGRREGTLKEGTKTVFPVSFEEAQKVFEKLQDSKINKGYHVSGGITETVKKILSPDINENEARKEQILSYLEKIAKGEELDTNWDVSRIVWRAGELKIKEAVESLNQVSSRNEMESYVLIWSLARCGNQYALPKIKEIGTSHSSEMIQKLIAVILLRHGNEMEKTPLKEKIVSRLPGAMKEFVLSANWGQLQTHLNDCLYNLKTQDNQFLEDLYMLSIGNPELSDLIRKLIVGIPFKPNYFKHLRFIFKMSEMLEQDDMYAVMLKKVEESAPYFNSPKWSDQIYRDGDYLKVPTELKAKNAKLAYSSKTKGYFLKRMSRWIDRKIASEDPHYTQLATEILLNYSEEDNKGDNDFGTYQYIEKSGRYEWITISQPAYYQYHYFNKILFENSERIVFAKSHSRWHYKDKDSKGAVSDKREEACPMLWDQDCGSLVRLLKDSACEPVQNFAAKAFLENPSKKDYYSLELVSRLVQKYYEISHQLGLTVAKELFDPANPQKELIMILIQAKYDLSRKLGLQWFLDHKDYLLEDTMFVTGLLFSGAEDVQLRIRDVFSTHAWKKQVKEQVSYELITRFSELEEDVLSGTQLQRICETVSYLFREELSNIPSEMLISLIDSESKEIQGLIVEILLNHQQSVDEFPSEVFIRLIADPSDEIRGLGMKLFEKLSESKLKERKEMIAAFCISEHPEVRQGARAIVGKLAKFNSLFGVELIDTFLPIFYDKEKYEGLHQDLYQLFTDALGGQLSKIPINNVWKLIRSNSLPATELGHYLLKTHFRLSTLTIEEALELGNHELRDLRVMAWNFYQQQVSKIKYDLEKSVRLTDASWEDSREFAFNYFDINVTSEWTPAILISLCDCNRIEVQQYGKKLISKFFESADGVEYMVKLSQHPNVEMQLYVSNYLDRYASGNLDNIKELTYYFTSVLSQVNRGRTGKERVYHFIRREALQNEAVAAWFIPLLMRISLSISVKDRGKCLELLYHIQSKYNHLETNLTINEIPTL